MAGMEVDSPPERNFLSPQEQIIERLGKCGVPEDSLAELQPGLVKYVKENKSAIPQLVAAILPSEQDVSESEYRAVESGNYDSSNYSSANDRFHENFLWLQWLMFEDEPQSFLRSLATASSSHKGVCGAVWGDKDIAYRCRTCENDPTCAICVTCFKNGNHEGHDYSIMYTGGGCCDCGDITAWKREGFCQNHKGAEQIQPLPLDIARSMGPVIDTFLVCWRDKLLKLEKVVNGGQRAGDGSLLYSMFLRTFSAAVVTMLLDFCHYSESLLSFISKQMLVSVGLLDILVRAEQFLHESEVGKLHELLLKFLGEPIFKQEFAKAFIGYYPFVVNKAIEDFSDEVFEKYPLLSTFSVQIYTVPTLTPRLVKEVNLLGMLLGCLGDLFLACLGEEGHLQVNRFANLYMSTLRIITDIRFVMSHAGVPEYVVCELPEIFKTWITLLSLVQGMDPQRRVTGLHVEEENENTQNPFALGFYIGILHSLLVVGAFSSMESDGIKENDANMDESYDSIRHAKVGRFSQESSVSSSTRSILHTSISHLPSSVRWLLLECLKAIENWLELGPECRRLLNSLIPRSSSSTSHNNKQILRRLIFKVRSSGGSRTHVPPHLFGSANRSVTLSEVHRRSLPFAHVRSGLDTMDENRAAEVEGDKSVDVIDMAPTVGEQFADYAAEAEDPMDIDSLGLLNLKDWPEFKYDVSSQDVSFHIPLHRLLSLVLQKVLKRCCEEGGLIETEKSLNLSCQYPDLFRKILHNCHPNAFSALIMEHPLRLRVFCAQLRAGLWRKNGDPPLASYEWYRSIKWCEQGLEFDLFLLQCCASMGPPDFFVKRIQDRFGLSRYLSLNPERPNEYEPVLVQEMLALIIQIVQERKYCGFSTAENLRRELICKLAVGDATHSHLLKSLPHDLSKSDQLQKTLDELALYLNPSGLKQGKYSLRRKFWKELDLYHPRWSSRDLQIAEERYMRFCRASVSVAQLPQWTKIYYPLFPVSRIATCKAVLEIIRTVVFYAYFSENTALSRAPDGVLLTALHLLSLAIDVSRIKKQLSAPSIPCKSSSGTSLDEEGYVSFVDYACEDLEGISLAGINSRTSWKHQSLLSLLVLLMRKYKQGNDWTPIEANQCNFSLLIENLLKRISELDERCLSILQRLAPDVFCALPTQVYDSVTEVSVSTMDAVERRAKIRERQAAILEKMKAEQSKFIASLNKSESFDLDPSNVDHEASISENPVFEESGPLVCSLCRDPDSKSPVSFLILLQKSRLTTFVERGHRSWQDVCSSYQGQPSLGRNEVQEQSRMVVSSSSNMISSAQLVNLVQNAVSEYTNEGRSADIDGFLEFIRSRLPDIKNQSFSNESHDSRTDATLSLELLEDDLYQSIMIDIHDIMRQSHALEEDNIILKPKRDEVLEKNEDAYSAVLGEYVAFIRKDTRKYPSAHDDDHSLQYGNVWPRLPFSAAFDGFGPSNCDGIHVSSCGHAVHQECRDRYLSSLSQRFVRRIVFERGSIVDPDQGEFLCPVCRRLANSVLPVVSADQNKLSRFTRSQGGNLASYSTLTTAEINDTNNIHHLPLALSLLKSATKEVGHSKVLKSSSRFHLDESITSSLESVLHTLCKLYYAEKSDSVLASGRTSLSVLLWDALRYSLVATEIAARSGGFKMSTGGSDHGLQVLYKEVGSPAEFILSNLLQVAQAIRSQSGLQVLLRFRGIQLFYGSICSGLSMDKHFGRPGQEKSSMASNLRQFDKNFPDILFWKRAADPVLAHDPFSSLMWLLFCLPRKFLLSTESFSALVHLFYVVCVIQGLIAFSLNNSSVSSKTSAPLINHIKQIMGQSHIAQQYFVSSHVCGSDVHDSIRRLTHPYLRRCGLLWKLLECSPVTPFGDSSFIWDWSSSHKIDGNAKDLSMDLCEVGELEKMFKILSLDMILKDQLVHSLTMKWCEHFCKDSEVRNNGQILYCNPAVPFTLIQLPQLYQDLLQRYIKAKCPDCNNVPQEYALCLLCGKLCSPSWKLCCRESESQNHAMSCGAGVGVFLLIRKTTILLQRSSRVAQWPSPYLDAFGEEDVGMLRGRPLYLSEERYAALTYMVASHGLDRSSEVLRQTTLDAIFAA